MTAVTRTLYRPVGLKEAELILQAEAKAFPPRLPEQPYFYPVLSFEYAEQIARDWNTKDQQSGYAGFVTEFQVVQDYLAKFEVHTVGATKHQELWIPAEELAGFNRNIVGEIEIKAAYYGSGYKGAQHWSRTDWYADNTVVSYYWSAPMDLYCEIYTNHHAILLNFRYWVEKDYSTDFPVEFKRKLLSMIASLWQDRFPDVYLPGSELVE